MPDEIPPPETWPNYSELRSCQKYCFTACQEGNNPNASQLGQPCTSPSSGLSSSEPRTYHGLIAQINCPTISCICRFDKWMASMQTLYDCGVAYCHTRIGTPALPDHDFEQSVNVLTGFCSDNGYHLQEFILDIGKNSSVEPPRSDNSNALSRGDIIAIGCSGPIGFITLCVNVAMLYYQIRRSNARNRQDQTQVQLPQQPAVNPAARTTVQQANGPRTNPPVKL